MKPIHAALILATSALFACAAPTPASLQFQGAAPPNPTIGQGATLTFKALSAAGQPMGNVAVKFALKGSPSGVTLSTKSATTEPLLGTAQVTVTAETRITSVTVVATVGATSASGSVTFAGTSASNASAAQFTFQCGATAGAGSGGIHAIGAFDESRNLIAGVKVICSAHVADINGDAIVGAPVSFLTEAGTIEASSITVSDVAGNADVLYKTSLPLPQDVDPVTFTWALSPLTRQYVAPLWMEPYNWVENPTTGVGTPGNEPRRPDPIRPGIINNPRDNLVTLIAVTNGQEAFVDLNGNGVRDGNEPFTDLGEPFVDANDNGVFDPGEKFIDVNGNGQWDGPNGKWDSNTTIWTEERILWTGFPAAQDSVGPYATLVLKSTSNLTLPHFGGGQADYFLADPWWNAIARNAATDGCSQSSGSNLVTISSTSSEFGVRPVYPPGDHVTIFLKDVHDPAANPPVPPLTVALGWTVYPRCTFTSSPDQGFTYTVGFPAVSGTVL